MVERIRLVLRVQISDPVNPNTVGIVFLVIRHRALSTEAGRWLNRSPKPGASKCVKQGSSGLLEEPLCAFSVLQASRG